MNGTFYGIGVGPGDPELLTLKAIRIMKECDMLAIALSGSQVNEPKRVQLFEQSEYKMSIQECVAYQIALTAVPELKAKELLLLPMPMIKDRQQLDQIHEADAAKVMEILNEGKSIAFITLGDPTIYSTVLYVHRRIKSENYNTSLVPGIPSFCAAAAKLNTGLAENREELHIIPASYEVEESLKLSGTKVLMKAGKQIRQVKQLLQDDKYQVELVENCGMEQEKIYRNVDEIPETASYYSLMIVKERLK